MANETKAISHKPGKKEMVYGLAAPRRGSGGSHSMTAKWSLGKWATDSKNAYRIEGFDIYFTISCYNRGTKKWVNLYYQYSTPNTARRDWTINLDGGVKCTNGKTYRRDTHFYPMTNLMLRSVTAKVRTYNRKGKGDWVSATYRFDTPYKPRIESIEQDADTGKVKVKVSHNKGQNWRETWRTEVTMKVWSSWENKYITNRTGTISTNSDSETFQSIDAYARMLQSYDQWLTVRVWATTKGLWGNSETAEKRLYISWPYQPKVSVGKIDSSELGQDYLNSKVTVRINTDPREDKSGYNAHPTTGVRLQKLVNVDYENGYDIPGDADWKDCGAVDNGGCSALSSTVAELQPERGKKTWIRVKSWNQIEDIFYRYSNVVRLEDLERLPRSASESKIKAVAAQSGDDGESAVVDIGWGADEASGTEVSWSDSKNAWRSTRNPETYRIDYDDGSRTITVDDTEVSCTHSARVNIPDLTEGTTYYVRARRYYVDEDDNESFGPYYPPDTIVDGIKVCDSVPVKPVTSPNSVTLGAPAFVSRGASIPLSWTFDSDAEQTEWQLITGTAVRLTKVVDGSEVKYWRIDESNRSSTDQQTGETNVTTASVVILARGTDAMGSYTLAYDDHLEQIINPPGEEPDDEIPLAVRVKTGGEFVTSDAVWVALADPPTLSVSAANVTAQPMSVELTCNAPAIVSIVVSAGEIAGQYARGAMVQTSGDTIWSTVTRLEPEYDSSGNVTNPGWVYDDNDGLYHATIYSSEGLNLLDNGKYTVKAKATHPSSGLTSSEATCELSVDYARKAPLPSRDIVVTPYDRIDSVSGVRQRGCEIALTLPPNNIATFGTAPKTDVYNASTNPDGVWGMTLSDRFTQLEDGWWHYECDNSSGSSAINETSFRPKALSDVTEGNTYSILLEWRNNQSVATNAQSFVYVQQTDNNQFWGDSDPWRIPYRNGGESGSRGGTRTPDTAHKTPDAYNELFRLNFRVQPGDKASFDFRISLYKGAYDGGYVAPATAAQAAADLYDVYRVTADGPQLCAESVPMDATVNDLFAPYGEEGDLAYRVCCRTVDGCEDYLDYPYELAGTDMRIDFGKEYVELPYNLKADDSYEKDFEARRHLDGSIDGYWNEGAKRTASLSTDLIRIREEEKARAVRRLARYCGPTYVRLGDGTAYQADVQVRGLGREASSAAIAVSINATEVGLTEDFMATSNVASEEPEQAQGGEG